MFTESSKPTIAKNASPVAAITPPSTERSPVSNSVTREKSPSPMPSAQTPTPMTISRPVSSTQVSTTLALTLSPTPRWLTSATRRHEAQADQRDPDALAEAEAEDARRRWR